MDGYNENLESVSGCIEDAETIEYWETYNAELISAIWEETK